MEDEKSRQELLLQSWPRVSSRPEWPPKHRIQGPDIRNPRAPRRRSKPDTSSGNDKYTCCICRVCTRKVKPQVVKCLVYFGAAITFTVGLLLPLRHPEQCPFTWSSDSLCHPDWHPDPIRSSVHRFAYKRLLLQRCCPYVGNILPVDYHTVIQESLVIAILIWGLHLLRKFSETTFIQVSTDRYRRKIGVLELVVFTVFMLFMGFWNGFAVNINLKYTTPYNPFAITGMIVFSIGELGCILCRVKLKKQSNRSHSGHDEEDSEVRTWVVPQGCLYSCTYSPQYVFEMVSLGGMSLTVFTMPMFTYWAVMTFILMVYGIQNGRRVRQLSSLQPV